MMNFMKRLVSLRRGWAFVILLTLAFAGCETTDAGDEAGAEAGEEAGAEVGDEVGAETGDEAGGDDMIEIMGTGTNDYDGPEEITADAWNGTAIVSFSNQDNWVVTQNAADLPEEGYGVASAFNKIVWSEPLENTFYYCWVVFDMATQEEAEGAVNMADADDMSGAGCGGFPWTMVTLSDD